MIPAKHGANGWVLEDMDWDSATGVSRFEYSKRLFDGSLAVEVRTEHQATSPRHGGWPERMREHTVYSLHA